MRNLVASFLVAAVGLGACATAEAPKKTVASLSPKDPKYRTAKCRQAREEAQTWNDHPIVRTGIAVGGNLAAPGAGTVAAMALNHQLDGKRRELSDKVARNCLSDPLANKR